MSNSCWVLPEKTKYFYFGIIKENQPTVLKRHGAHFTLLNIITATFLHSLTVLAVDVIQKWF